MKNGNRPRLLLNVASNWTAYALSLVVAFFLSPFLVHHLGPSAYGVWVLSASIGGYLGLLELGIRGAVTFSVARYHTQGEHAEASRLVSSALVLFILCALVALTASAAIGPILTRLLHRSILGMNLNLLLILVGASVAATLISNVFGAIVVGLQRFEIVGSIETGITVARAIVIMLALKNGHGVIAVAIIQLCSSLVLGLLYAWASRRLYPQLSLQYALWDPAHVRRIASFGGCLFILNISTQIILFTDSLVVGAFLPIAMVTFFSIAGGLVAYSRGVINAVCYVLSPLVSSLDAEGKRDRIGLMSVAGPRYTTMLMLPIIITFVLRGKTFIGLWMGSAFALPSGSVLQVLSLALFFGAANQIATSMMVGINRHRPVVFATAAEAIANLALSIGLVHSMGIVGVAWGTAIPTVASSLIFWPAYVRRVFNISASQYIFSTWGRPTIAVIPFSLAALLIEKTWYASTVSLFLIQVAVSLPIAFVCFWFSCLSETERRSWIGQLISASPRLGEPA